MARALGLAMAILCLHAQTRAQTAGPAPAASGANSPEISVSDRVKKDAAGPLYWIRLNAQKADAAGTARPSPRITEIRTEARAPRPPQGQPQAQAQAVPARSQPLPAAGPARPAGTSTSAELAVGSPAVADTAPAAVPGNALTGAAAAGLAAPAGSSATEAARTAAAAEPPADEPDDQPLAVLKAEEPDFPANVMRKLRKGTVQVRFEVQADGSVADVAVVQTTHRSLNNAAIEAVTAWRFEPVRTPRSAVVDLGFDLDG
jgi:TonB family protein